MSTSRLRAAVVGAVLGAVAVAGMVGSAYQAPEAAATAQTVHRAGVVVEGYAPRCITFSSESVSGTQALQLAGFSPTIRSYSGEGGAVCAINGTGCAADANCLTCAAPNYWAYFRSDAGSGGFTYSSGAATSSQVTDGDVEGWRWGTGAAPGYVSFADACPITTPTTTSTTSPPSGGTTGGGNGNGGGGDPGGSTTGSNGGGAPGGNPGGADGRSGGGPDGGPTTTAGGPTTTTESTAEDEADTSSSGDEAEEVDGEEAAAVGPVVEDDSGGGGAGTWVLFAALLAGFGLVGWRVRSVRSRSS